MRGSEKEEGLSLTELHFEGQLHLNNVLATKTTDLEARVRSLENHGGSLSFRLPGPLLQ